MKTITQLKKNEGFTLVELLISVVIMAIAFAGLATMQIACINGNSIASNLTTAITLAQDKMEDLNNRVDTDESPDPDLTDRYTLNNNDLSQAICDGTGATEYPDGHKCDTASPTMLDDEHRENGVDDQGSIDAGGMYTRIWNVADDTPVPGRKTVTVIVTWKDRQVSVTSIIGAPFS